MQAIANSGQWSDFWNEHGLRSYLLGTELEMLMTPKPHTNIKVWSDLVKYLEHDLNQEIVHAEFVEDTKEWDYGKWAITADGSIVQNRGAGEMAIEFISPIYTPSAAKHMAKVQTFNEGIGASERIWQTITKAVDVIDEGPNYESCGTHVHISTMKPGPSTSVQFEHFRHLARAVVYFERCVDSLMPPHRRTNKWCRSNRYNGELKALDISQVLAKIDELNEHSNGLERLTDLLCPSLENGNRRCYRWNFMNLLKDNPNRRTVEFRQPPGATTVYRVTVWTKFALAFFRGAVICGYGILGGGPSSQNPTVDASEPATFERLINVLRSGCNHSWDGDIDLSDLEPLFVGKSMLDDGPWMEETFGTNDAAMLRTKERNGQIVSRRLQAGVEEMEKNALPFAGGMDDDQDIWG